MRPKRHRYNMLSKRDYTQKDGKITFRLNHVEKVNEFLHTLLNSKWERHDVNRKKDLLLPLEPGIYAIVITNNKNKTDIAYIGSSYNLGRRFFTHQTLHFLKNVLPDSHKIEVYVNLVKEGCRSEEKKAIMQFKPFLNKTTEKRVFIEYFK